MIVSLISCNKSDPKHDRLQNQEHGLTVHNRSIIISTAGSKGFREWGHSALTLDYLLWARLRTQIISNTLKEKEVGTNVPSKK